MSFTFKLSKKYLIYLQRHENSGILSPIAGNFCLAIAQLMKIRLQNSMRDNGIILPANAKLNYSSLIKNCIMFPSMARKPFFWTLKGKDVGLIQDEYSATAFG